MDNLKCVQLQEIVSFTCNLFEEKGLPRWHCGKEPTCQCRRLETWVQSQDWEDSLEEGMATHSGILAWNPMDRGAWRATVHSSWTQIGLRV